MKVNFDSYSYYPALRTRAAEILGLSKLAHEKKEKILPLITLGKWPRSDEIQISLDKSLEAMNNLPLLKRISIIAHQALTFYLPKIISQTG